jgi:hypothetical protein
MVIVTWRRCESHKWHTLEGLSLSRIVDVGVYIVWYSGTPGRVVCVGQGSVAKELARVRTNEEVLRFAARGPLLVTWAPVSARRIDGVTRYLTEAWPPLIDQPHADVPSIEVNSPAWLRPFV